MTPTDKADEVGTQEYTLRAMATNYGDGPHQWDHLDKEACAKAADEIRRQRDLIASMKAERDEALEGKATFARDYARYRDEYLPRMLRAEAQLATLKARLAEVEGALLWSMDEIDVLSNKLCDFAYPQGMAMLGRTDQTDAYEAAVHVRRSALLSTREGGDNG